MSAGIVFARVSSELVHSMLPFPFMLLRTYESKFAKMLIDKTVLLNEIYSGGLEEARGLGIGQGQRDGGSTFIIPSRKVIDSGRISQGGIDSPDQGKSNRTVPLTEAKKSLDNSSTSVH